MLMSIAFRILQITFINPNLSKSLSFLNQSLETITSDTSLAPFDRDDLSEMLEITSVSKLISLVEIHPYWMCVLDPDSCSRFAGLSYIYSTSRPVPDTHPPCHRSPLLFGAPYIHAQGLNDICVDQPFIYKLNSEWEAFTLYSPVILNAIIAFLDDPNINPVVRISSYLPTINIVSAIILGLLLMCHNRTHKQDSAEDAVS
ncbi:hypothetical protein C8R48DRAFT_767843 [Suillus tomentosus]|nr:hypothetical protein C8R48DRAFT_767843 [Suillus tomentosus]